MGSNNWEKTKQKAMLSVSNKKYLENNSGHRELMGQLCLYIDMQLYRLIFLITEEEDFKMNEGGSYFN